MSLGGSGVSIGGVRILRVVSLMVNWWFGAQWFGFLGFPENKKDCHLGVCIPRPKPPGPKPWMLMVFFGIRYTVCFFWLPRYMQRNNMEFTLTHSLRIQDYPETSGGWDWIPEKTTLGKGERILREC